MDRSYAYFTDKLVEVQQISGNCRLYGRQVNRGRIWSGSAWFRIPLPVPHCPSEGQKQNMCTCRQLFVCLYLKIQDHVLYFFDFSSPFVSCLWLVLSVDTLPPTPGDRPRLFASKVENFQHAWLSCVCVSLLHSFSREAGGAQLWLFGPEHSCSQPASWHRGAWCHGLITQVCPAQAAVWLALVRATVRRRILCTLQEQFRNASYCLCHTVS